MHLLSFDAVDSECIVPIALAQNRWLGNEQSEVTVSPSMFLRNSKQLSSHKYRLERTQIHGGRQRPII